MNWKFWQKQNAPGNAPRGLSRPKDLPEFVGRHLVVDLKMDPDWVWALKAVSRRREDDKNIEDIKIFNPEAAEAAGVHVRDYHSLDASPDLVLGAGWINTKTHQLKLNLNPIEKAA
jgi:hypothetical protein